MRYNSPPNSPLDSLRDFVTRGGIPVTTTLLAVNGATFLLALLFPSLLTLMGRWVAFSSFGFLRAPWTFVTYPLVYLDVSTQGLWNFLIGGFFFWSWGGSLERSWGSARYAKLFFSLTIVSAAFVLLGCFVLGQMTLLDSFFLPLAGVTVAFCTLRPTEMVSFMFFPLQARYLAWIAVLFTWVYFGQGGRPLLGLFGCGGILCAYLYMRFGRSWSDIGAYHSTRSVSRGPDLRAYPPASRFTTRPPKRAMDGSPTQRSPFDLAGRWRDYQERKRLEKLWRNSGFSDPEREPRDDDKRRR